MSVLIKGMELPESCSDCAARYEMFCPLRHRFIADEGRRKDCPLIEIPPHGRLIDADVLRARMYHEAFETDTPMQKWDSGCWIRYKMFELMEETSPTIIPAEEGET